MKIYDKTTQTYKELVLKPGGDTLPIGAIIAFSGETVPSGWLLCDGSSFSATSYPELFDVIGVTYGWDDDRNPKLPDLRGRVAVGKKDATSADDTEFSSLGNTGGEKEHTLTIDEMPSHDHTLKPRFLMWDSGDSYEIMNGDNTWSGNIQYNAYDSDNYITRNTGGGQPHNNLQPYIVTNYIIKAKNTVVVKGDVIQETGTASETNVYSSVAVDNKIKTNIVTGQEVVTNEYIDGKQVFVKRINLGTLPNSNTLILATGIPSTSIITKYDAMAYASNYTITLPDVAPSNLNLMARITFEAINSVWNVKIITGFDRSNYTGYVNIYYTKN